MGEERERASRPVGLAGRPIEISGPREVLKQQGRVCFPSDKGNTEEKPQPSRNAKTATCLMWKGKGLQGGKQPDGSTEILALTLEQEQIYSDYFTPCQQYWAKSISWHGVAKANNHTHIRCGNQANLGERVGTLLEDRFRGPTWREGESPLVFISSAANVAPCVWTLCITEATLAIFLSVYQQQNSLALNTKLFPWKSPGWAGWRSSRSQESKGPSTRKKRRLHLFSHLDGNCQMGFKAGYQLLVVRRAEIMTVPRHPCMGSHCQE